jgi:hypothetical protein
MSTFTDYAKLILAGGLPAVLDDPSMRTAQGDTRPEQTAPSAGILDAEPYMIGSTPVPAALVIGAFVVAAVVLTYAIARK